MLRGLDTRSRAESSSRVRRAPGARCPPGGSRLPAGPRAPAGSLEERAEGAGRPARCRPRRSRCRPPSAAALGVAPEQNHGLRVGERCSCAGRRGGAPPHQYDGCADRSSASTRPRARRAARSSSRARSCRVRREGAVLADARAASIARRRSHPRPGPYRQHAEAGVRQVEGLAGREQAEGAVTRPSRVEEVAAEPWMSMPGRPRSRPMLPSASSAAAAATAPGASRGRNAARGSRS